MIDVGRTVGDRVEDGSLCAVVRLTDAVASVREPMRTVDGLAIEWHHSTLTQFDAIEHLWRMRQNIKIK